MVNVEFKFPDWFGKYKRKEKEIQMFIAAQIQTNRGMLFANEGAYNGHEPWAPLKFRNGQILSKSGALRKSFSPNGAKGKPGPNGIVQLGDKVTVGTTLPYARLMNDGTAKMPGGVLKSPTGKALAIPLPPGKKASDFAQEEQKKNNAKVRKLNSEVRRALKGIGKAKTPGKALKSAANYEAGLEKLSRAKNNKNVIFRMSVKIPARPFDTWTDQDAKELDIAVANKLREVLFG